MLTGTLNVGPMTVGECEKEDGGSAVRVGYNMKVDQRERVVHRFSKVDRPICLTE